MIIKINEINGAAVGFYTTRDTCIFKEPSDYKELCSIFGITPENIARASQTHTDKIRIITEKEVGEGVVKPLSMTDFDGIATNIKGVMLCTVEADCTPVYLYEKNGKAAAMVHSGWRGCSSQITKNALSVMVKDFNCDAENIVAVIGPHICRNCYEVGEELIDDFATLFGDEAKTFFEPKGNGKYLLDMEKPIISVLKSCGVKSENISSVGLCTFEEGNLCSYRKTGSKTERMLTGIMLK